MPLLATSALRVAGPAETWSHGCSYVDFGLFGNVERQRLLPLPGSVTLLTTSTEEMIDGDHRCCARPGISGSCTSAPGGGAVRRPGDRRGGRGCRRRARRLDPGPQGRAGRGPRLRLVDVEPVVQAGA